MPLILSSLALRRAPAGVLLALLLLAAAGTARAQAWRRPSGGQQNGISRLQEAAAADHARLLALSGPGALLERLQESASNQGGSGALSAPIGTGPSALCEKAIAESERTEGIPAGLLTAIAVAESGRPDARGVRRPWPWTLDIDGAAHYYDGRPAAVAGLRDALAHGATAVDVGCMQVDLQQHPDAFTPAETGFDPAVNVRYAARFLKSLWFAEPHRDWMVAAGYYHSHTEPLAASYRRLVAWTGPARARAPAF